MLVRPLPVCSSAYCAPFALPARARLPGRIHVPDGNRTGQLACRRHRAGRARATRLRTFPVTEPGWLRPARTRPGRVGAVRTKNGAEGVALRPGALMNSAADPPPTSAYHVTRRPKRSTRGASRAEIVLALLEFCAPRLASTVFPLNRLKMSIDGSSFT